MPIEPTTSFRYLDQLFPSEEAAVAAGLKVIAHDLMRAYSSDPLRGIEAHADELLYLLGKRQAAIADKAGSIPIADPLPKGQKGPVDYSKPTYWRTKAGKKHRPSCRARALGRIEECDCPPEILT